MLRKKLLLLLLLVTLLVSVSTADNARACSGDLCGCGVEGQWCEYECQFYPPEYQWDCRRACRRAAVRCSIDCCSW